VPSRRYQSLTQQSMVFHNSVVHHRHCARFVRMGVLLGRSAVGGPARVPDSHQPVRALDGQQFLQCGELAPAAHQPRALAIGHRDAGRVITAILQSAQPVDENGSGFTLSDVTNDSAHSLSSLFDYGALGRPICVDARRVSRQPTRMLFPHQQVTSVTQR